MNALGIPGAAVAVVLPDGSELIRAYGEAAPGRAVTKRTRFNLASLTKPITAMGILQLVEDDRVSLDEPVAMYLPELELPTGDAGVTLEHLLTHTSGVSTRAGRRHFMNPDTTIDARDHFVRGLRSSDWGPSAGTGFRYSNVNYQLLAAVLETVTGEPFEDYMTRAVLEPIGMRDSRWTAYDARTGDYAQAYHQWFGLPVATSGLPVSRVGNGSGGLYASAADLAAMLRLQLGLARGATEVLSERSVVAQRQPRVQAGPTSHYGYGWSVVETSAGVRVAHGGSVVGTHTDLLMRPADRVGVAVLMNVNSLPKERAFFDLAANVLSIVDGLEPRPLRRLWGYTAVYLIPFAVLVLQGALIGRRMLTRGEVEYTKRRFALSVMGGFLVVAWFFAVIPALFQADLSVAFQWAPDFAWASLLCSVVGLALTLQTVTGTLRRSTA